MQTHFGHRAASSVPLLLAALTLPLPAGLVVASGPALSWPVAAALALAFGILLSVLVLTLEAELRR